MKQKIAESIIIRVGHGVMEIPRKPPAKEGAGELYASRATNKLLVKNFADNRREQSK